MKSNTSCIACQRACVRARQSEPMHLKALRKGNCDETGRHRTTGRRGIPLGPGAGHLLADLVTGEKPIFDAAHHNPARSKHSAWGKVDF